MSEQAIAAAINSAIDFAFANPILTLLGLIGLAIGLVVGFFVFIGIPFAIGSTMLATVSQPDPGFFLSWLAGIAFLAGVLLVIASLVGFVRFSWYAWA